MVARLQLEVGEQGVDVELMYGAGTTDKLIESVGRLETPPPTTLYQLRMNAAYTSVCTVSCSRHRTKLSVC